MLMFMMFGHFCCSMINSMTVFSIKVVIYSTPFPLRWNVLPNQKMLDVLDIFILGPYGAYLKLWDGIDHLEHCNHQRWMHDGVVT